MCRVAISCGGCPDGSVCVIGDVKRGWSGVEDDRYLGYRSAAFGNSDWTVAKPPCLSILTSGRAIDIDSFREADKFVCGVCGPLWRIGLTSASDSMRRRFLVRLVEQGSIMFFNTSHRCSGGF